MRALLLAGTAAVVMTGAVYAATPDKNANEAKANLRDNLAQMLTKSGFTDLRIAPNSFTVRAKDSDGNPVVMSISPDSFAAVTTIDGASTTTGRAPDAANDTYVSVPKESELSSQLVGLDIYNNDNKDIGTIKDVAFDSDGEATAYIVSVGGFLGMGDHYVAINPAAVNVTYDDNASEWHASMNATADQLRSAPEFKYTGRWSNT
jgi:sporulation protein YlmC with PRC-barrel domain